MEEAIRKINLSIIQAEYYGLDSIIERIEIKTLKDILNRLDRLQKENEELNYKYHKSLEDIVVLSKNSIPKEKIEEIIRLQTKKLNYTFLDMYNDLKELLEEEK